MQRRRKHRNQGNRSPGRRYSVVEKSRRVSVAPALNHRRIGRLAELRAALSANAFAAGDAITGGAALCGAVIEGSGVTGVLVASAVILLVGAVHHGCYAPEGDAVTGPCCSLEELRI